MDARKRAARFRSVRKRDARKRAARFQSVRKRDARKRAFCLETGKQRERNEKFWAVVDHAIRCQDGCKRDKAAR